MITSSPELPQPGDLDWLREQFPGWRFGTIWASAATGPDARRIYATRGAVTITAWNAAALAADIRHSERENRPMKRS